MQGKTTAAVLTACLAISAAGCGSGSDSTSGSTTGAANQQTTTSGGSKPATPAQGPSQGPQGGQGEKQEPTRGTGEEFGKGDPYSAPKGADNSVQVYGEEAGRAERAEVTKAMFAYFRALAAQNYAKVCAGFSEITKKQLEAFMKSQHRFGDCASLLKELHQISPGGTLEAKRAAEGSVGHVRIGEGNAFVLFTPAGGRPSYFVMKKEDGEWKSISDSTGAPLVP